MVMMRRYPIRRAQRAACASNYGRVSCAALLAAAVTQWASTPYSTGPSLHLLCSLPQPPPPRPYLRTALQAKAGGVTRLTLQSALR